MGLYALESKDKQLPPICVSISTNPSHLVFLIAWPRLILHVSVLVGHDILFKCEICPLQQKDIKTKLESFTISILNLHNGCYNASFLQEGNDSQMFFILIS